MTTRRNFLGSILASGFAPAVVKAGIIMPVKALVVPAESLSLITPAEYSHTEDALRYIASSPFRGDSALFHKHVWRLFAPSYAYECASTDTQSLLHQEADQRS